MRLRHVKFDSIKMMTQKEMLQDLPSIEHPNQLCKECLVDKLFHKSFPKESIAKESQPLQEIHVDACGPI